MIGTFCSIKFYLNTRTQRSETEVPIYMRLVIRRKKSELFLNQFIDPMKWDDNKQRIKSEKKSEAFINHKLNEIETKVNQIIWDLEEEKEIVSAKSVMSRLTGRNVKTKHTLLNFFAQYIMEIEAKKEISKPVITQYYTCKTHLENYLKSTSREDVLLTQFKRADIDAFEHYLLTLVNDVLKRTMHRNTANKYLVRLKTVMINAVKKQLITANPFHGIKIKNMRTENIFLTAQELVLLKKHKLAGNESLIRVRDFFLFSVYTGLRYMDSQSLTIDNIKKEKNRMWIVGTQKKTGEPIEIPMLKQAKEIYDKYEEYRLATGFVLPRLHNQKVNTYLREIMSLVGIKKDIHFHCSRHTFATTILLENNVDIKTVSRLLGHFSVKSTEVYAKVTKELLENVAKRIDKV